MNTFRKGQVAFLLLKHYFRKKGVIFTPNFWQEIEKEAKVIGASTEEIGELMEIVARELIEEMFSKPDKKN